jgi:hypothetical protein
MTIEALLTRLCGALEAQTEAMHTMMKSGGKPAEATGKPAAVKPAAGKPAADKPAASSKAKEEAAVKAAADRVTTYLKAGDKDDRAAAKDNVGKIIEHFGSDRFTTIPAESLDEALDMLTDFEEGRTPEAFGGGGDEDGDEDGNLV